MATFADAHYQSRIQVSGKEPVFVLTEPAACAGGCGESCCTVLTQTGRREPLHLPASTPITVLTVPGGGA